MIKRFAPVCIVIVAQSVIIPRSGDGGDRPSVSTELPRA